MSQGSEAAGHFSAVAGTTQATHIQNHWNYPHTRQRKVTITKEYGPDGKLVKEVRTEEWEPGPYWYGASPYVYGTTTTNGPFFKQ